MKTVLRVAGWGMACLVGVCGFVAWTKPGVVSAVLGGSLTGWCG